MGFKVLESYASPPGNGGEISSNTAGPQQANENEILTAYISNKENPLYIPSIKKAILSDSIIVCSIQIIIAIGSKLIL